MSVSDFLLYTGLFVAILATQLGTRRPDAKRLRRAPPARAAPRDRRLLRGDSDQ